jgi:hypothetical protein
MGKMSYYSFFAQTWLWAFALLLFHMALQIQVIFGESVLHDKTHGRTLNFVSFHFILRKHLNMPWT